MIYVNTELSDNNGSKHNPGRNRINTHKCNVKKVNIRKQWKFDAPLTYL